MYPVNAAVALADPARQCPPIPKPGMSPWLLRLGLLPRGSLLAPRVRSPRGLLAAFVAFPVVATFLGPALGPWVALAVVGALSLGAMALAPIASYTSRRVISRMGDRIGGLPITGAAWSLLRDTAIRFEDAKRMIDQVPTGFDWEEIWPDVNVLLWDAATHAAKVSSLDAELDEVKWAEPGTPQAAYRDALQRRRDDEYRIMQDAQWEAYSLQREAGNAAAAAKVALLHVGSVDALERVIPSTDAIRSRLALAEARARLQLLTEVWAELDPQHAVKSAAIEAYAREQAALPPGPRRRRPGDPSGRGREAGDGAGRNRRGRARRQ